MKEWSKVNVFKKKKKGLQAWEFLNWSKFEN